jgi:hypothetical protein
MVRRAEVSGQSDEPLFRQRKPLIWVNDVVEVAGRKYRAGGAKSSSAIAYGNLGLFCSNLLLYAVSPARSHLLLRFLCHGHGPSGLLVHAKG